MALSSDRFMNFVDVNGYKKLEKKLLGPKLRVYKNVEFESRFHNFFCLEYEKLLKNKTFEVYFTMRLAY